MLSVRGLAGRETVDGAGRRLGRVSRVLFHPSKPRVVGLEIGRPKLLYLYDRAPYHLRFGGLRISRARIVAEEAKTNLGRKAEKVQGFEWEQTVIWLGMTVRTESGTVLGAVGDVTFDAEGDVTSMLLTWGAVADKAHGTREIPGALVKGFDGEDVVVDDSVKATNVSGGAAAVAGRGVAVAKVKAGSLLRKGAEAGVGGIVSAARSKPVRSVVDVLRETKESFEDGYSDDTKPARGEDHVEGDG